MDLLEPMRTRYAGDPEMTVIVDRRSAERRDPPARRPASEQRVLRDRRRRRIAGELPSLHGETGASGA